MLCTICVRPKMEQSFFVCFLIGQRMSTNRVGASVKGEKANRRGKEAILTVLGHHHNGSMDATHTTAHAAESRREDREIVGNMSTDSTNNAGVPAAHPMMGSAMAPCRLLPLAKELRCSKASGLDHPGAHLIQQSQHLPTEQQCAAASIAYTASVHIDAVTCPTETALCCIAAYCEGLPGPPPLPSAIRQAFDAALACVSLAPAKGDALCGACAAIEALTRAYQYMPDEILADASLESVSIWILGAAGKHACARVCPAGAIAVSQVRDTITSVGIDDAPDVPAGTCAAGSESDGVALTRLGYQRVLPCDRLERIDTAIKDFAIGMLRVNASPPCFDSIDLCRGPVRLLARALRDAVASAHSLQSTMPNLSGADHAQIAIRRYMDRAEPSEVIACMLGLLLSIDAPRVNVRDQSDDHALRAIAPILADASHPLRRIVLQCLDIVGTDAEDTNTNNGTDRDDYVAPPDDATYPQDDLVVRVYEHEPDLFIDILSHADPKSISALALTSRSHCALIARTLRDDDARGDARRLKRVALSGTLWLQDYTESGMYRPRAHVITPTSLDQAPLPKLRPILSACGLMARIEKLEERTDLLFSMHKLATACALGCGGAVARYLSAIKCELDPHTTGKRQLAECRTRIAKCAGMYASPMMMRIAITAMSRLISEHRSSRSRFMALDQITEIQSLVINAVSGIVRGFALPSTRRRSLPDLPALVDVLCAFLAAVRRDMDGHGWAGKYTFAKLRATFRRAALAVLAPGTSLPMPSTRIRLASALFEAARPEPLW